MSVQSIFIASLLVVGTSGFFYQKHLDDVAAEKLLLEQAQENLCVNMEQELKRILNGLSQGIPYQDALASAETAFTKGAVELYYEQKSRQLIIDHGMPAFVNGSLNAFHFGCKIDPFDAYGYIASHSKDL